MVIVVEPSAPGLLAGWSALLDLAQLHPTGWAIIGAQMVALHAAEHGRMSPRQSLDLDILVNVRLLGNGTERLARALVAAGFDLEGQDAFGVGTGSVVVKQPSHPGPGRTLRADQAVDDPAGPNGVGTRRDPGTRSHRAR